MISSISSVSMYTSYVYPPYIPTDNDKRKRTEKLQPLTVKRVVYYPDNVGSKLDILA